MAGWKYKAYFPFPKKARRWRPQRWLHNAHHWHGRCFSCPQH